MYAVVAICNVFYNKNYNLGAYHKTCWYMMVKCKASLQNALLKGGTLLLGGTSVCCPQDPFFRLLRHSRDTTPFSLSVSS